MYGYFKYIVYCTFALTQLLRVILFKETLILIAKNKDQLSAIH